MSSALSVWSHLPQANFHSTNFSVTHMAMMATNFDFVYEFVLLLVALAFPCTSLVIQLLRRVERKIDEKAALRRQAIDCKLIKLKKMSLQSGIMNVSLHPR